jgi:hypothetical protein
MFQTPASLVISSRLFREEFFEIVVTSPAQVASAIQWEAMKKYVLVQCIFRGKVNFHLEDFLC